MGTITINLSQVKEIKPSPFLDWMMNEFKESEEYEICAILKSKLKE